MPHAVGVRAAAWSSCADTKPSSHRVDPWPERGSGWRRASSFKPTNPANPLVINRRASHGFGGSRVVCSATRGGGTLGLLHAQFLVGQIIAATGIWQIRGVCGRARPLIHARQAPSYGERAKPEALQALRVQPEWWGRAMSLDKPGAASGSRTIASAGDPRWNTRAIREAGLEAGLPIVAPRQGRCKSALTPTLPDWWRGRGVRLRANWRLLHAPSNQQRTIRAAPAQLPRGHPRRSS